MATVTPQSVLITGTSAGSIGSALAATFADLGLITFATARDISKIDASLSARPNVHTISLDVTSQESIAAAVAAVVAKTDGKLDYLVNNAGVGYTIPLADVDVETAKKVFNTNFWGVLSMTKAFMPLLVKAKGTIVNISSVGAVVNTPWIGIYSASKAALTMASETLRMELAPFGVNVVTAMIGLVNTNFHPNSLNFQLPNDSMYKSIEQHIADENSGKHNPPGMDVNVLANNLVDDILKKKTGQVWRGKSASMVKWATTFVPSRTFDGMVANGRGIDKLVQNVKEGKT